MGAYGKRRGALLRVAPGQASKLKKGFKLGVGNRCQRYAMFRKATHAACPHPDRAAGVQPACNGGICGFMCVLSRAAPRRRILRRLMCVDQPGQGTARNERTAMLGGHVKASYGIGIQGYDRGYIQPRVRAKPEPI